MAELLDASYQPDTLLKYTSVGVQRDDYSFMMDGHPIKKCASQGQQKTFLISLKLAQLSMMKSRHGASPILLLDDVFDKLDMKRVELLINMVSKDDFGQIFVTDSNKVRISDLVRKLDSESRFYSVKGGEFTEIRG
jgi:DNA replication and repair protein RecF